jgi:nitrite reductase/ring-hydroxylating ferredoxin subunit
MAASSLRATTTTLAALCHDPGSCALAPRSSPRANPLLISALTDVSKLAHVADVADIPQQRGLTVKIDALTLALFNLGGRIVAVDGACIRCASLLASGTVTDNEVICAGCGWRYDVTTGRMATVPKLRIDTFEVKVVGARVMIRNPYA